MNRKAAIDAVSEWFPEWKRERERLDELDKWQRGKNPQQPAPASATRDTKKLLELASSPWMGLVVSTCAQAMYVDGVRTADDAEPVGPITGPWRTWMANQMNARQIAVHRAALGYGYSFMTVLPGNTAAVMRGLSPRRMYAVYGDQANDEWPILALEFTKAPRDRWSVRLYDDAVVTDLSCDSMGNDVEWISESTHDLGVTPVVGYWNLLDLDGRSLGEVEPYVPLAGRIDKTNYDRLVTQHTNSWKKLWIAGMAKPDAEQVANGVTPEQQKLKLAQDDILVAEDSETKFGAFPASELQGYISAREADVKELAATSQTPAYALTGDLVNLSADALAAARSTLDQKVTERKTSFGVSHAQALRLAALAEGDRGGWEDVSLEVTWQDTSIRSLAGAADALGKIATQLGVPPAALWNLIPGVTKTTVDEWKRLAEEDDSLGKIATMLEQATQPVNPIGAA